MWHAHRAVLCGTLLALAAGCADDDSFDERYEAASHKLLREQRAIDSELARELDGAALDSAPEPTHSPDRPPIR